jgi:hypothetical protein
MVDSSGVVLSGKQCRTPVAKTVSRTAGQDKRNADMIDSREGGLRQE